MLLQSVLALEALDASGCVDQALLTGIERMAVRADFNMHLVGGRARFESVAARTGDYAAAIFRMDFGFHLPSSNRSYVSGTVYHQPTRQTIHSVRAAIFGLVAALLYLISTNPAFATPSPAAPKASPTPAAPGFAPFDQNIFSTVLALAPPGPNRAARALAISDRQLGFQEKIWLHPEFSPGIRKILDELPPRQGTALRAASLYSRKDIPWNELPENARQISVMGRPDGRDYLYEATNRYESPETPQHMAGAFTLRPSNSKDGTIRAVDGQVGGELLMDTYGAAGGLAFLSALLRFIRGDLRPPWDMRTGDFNQHDRAILDRFHAEMPAFSARLDHYFKFHNVLDEFSGSGDPVVLFNLDLEVQPGALKPYPELDKFYKSIAPAVVARTVIKDSQGNRWLETQFNRGHIRVICMVRRGLLTPYNARYEPTGDGIALDQVRAGVYHTESQATITRLGLTFGLEQLRFVTDFQHDRDSVATVTNMEAVPVLVAPPGIHKIIDLIAGEFLRVLAQGDGGFKASFMSEPEGTGLFRYAASAKAEFNYAPTLELLARVGDSVADQHSAEVKLEERKLGQELFDAFMSDYNNARPQILAVDEAGNRANAKVHH